MRQFKEQRKPQPIKATKQHTKEMGVRNSKNGRKITSKNIIRERGVAVKNRGRVAERTECATVTSSQQAQSLARDAQGKREEGKGKQTEKKEPESAGPRQQGKKGGLVKARNKKPL